MSFRAMKCGMGRRIFIRAYSVRHATKLAETCLRGTLKLFVEVGREGDESFETTRKFGMTWYGKVSIGEADRGFLNWGFRGGGL
jgi:hypothetical protein